MYLRQYDPAIARWTGIDPVIHYDKSTYNAFDNNPVFWADPSGANSTAEWLETNGLTQDDLITIYESDNNQVDNTGSNPDDIIFNNKRGKEIGRIITGSKEHTEIDLDVDYDMDPFGGPIKVNINEDGAAAVGINFELSANLGGGMHGGIGFVYFAQGIDEGSLFAYDIFGAGLGVHASIGAEGFVSEFNKDKFDSDLIGIESFLGYSYGYTGGVSIVGGSYSWSNIDNTEYEFAPDANTWTYKNRGGSLSGPIPKVNAGFKWYRSETFNPVKIELND